MTNTFKRAFEWSKGFYTKYLVRFFAALGAIAVIYLVIILVLFYRTQHISIPDSVILEINLEKQLVEYKPSDPLAQVMLRQKTSVRDVVDALEVASKDKRVKGLVAHIGAAPMGLATIQEIRDAVIAFRVGDRFAYAYAESFGEFGPGNGAYYLATAFDQIYLQPSGDLGFTGMIYEAPFLRGTLDKLKIKPRLDRRKEYKSAVNLYTEDHFTNAQREDLEKLMHSQFEQMLDGISQTRNIDKKDLMTLADQAPLLGEICVTSKLVDALLYRDEVYEKIKTKTPDAKLLYLEKYLQGAGRPHKDGPVIALIYGVGSVQRGAEQYNALSGSPSMSSDVVTAAFREAIKDDDVKAIVFRVDSPGGSYVASDTIWRSVSNAQEKGKSVIVSMGNVAGSGGYFVAMPAKKIVAQPGTITGSIGVYAGKMLTREFWKELTGITWDEVHTNKNSTMWTGTHDYTSEQWQKLQSLLDRIYEDFTHKAAQGRNIKIERILELAKGRIWTGQDAKEVGLVDELGGFNKALQLARVEAGLDIDAKITLKRFPRPKPPLEALFKGPSSSEASIEASITAQIAQQISPLYNTAVQNGLLEQRGVLQMPFIQQKW